MTRYARVLWAGLLVTSLATIGAAIGAEHWGWPRVIPNVMAICVIVVIVLDIVRGALDARAARRRQP